MCSVHSKLYCGVFASCSYFLGCTNSLITFHSQTALLGRLSVADSNTCLGLRVKGPIFLPGFNQIYILSTDFHESSISNFVEIRPVVATLIHADRQTDMPWLIGAHCDYANTPRKG